MSLVRRHIDRAGRHVGRAIWVVLGVVSLALGVVGIALPLLPTTPFLLLSAFAFSRSSERLHDWLISHAHLGPPIEAWRRYRAIARSSKWAATVALAVVFVLAVAAGVAPRLLAIHATVLVLVGVFLWTRPEPPAAADAEGAALGDASERGAG